MAHRAGQWEPTIFANAVQSVFGSTRRPDGTRQGGLGRLRGGAQVELPDLWTSDEFDRDWHRQDFAGATHEDGTPASAADVRRHFRPEFVRVNEDGGTVYALIGPNGGLLMNGEAPYTLTFPRSPNRARR